MRTSTFPALLCATLLTTGAFAQPLPATRPAAAGFSEQGLKRIEQFFAREMAAERVPGAVVAIARDGKLVHFEAYGYQDKAAGKAMKLDTIFELASMTKIMTSVAVLTLNEEGRLPLKAPLAEYYPVFAKMQVGIPGELAKPIFIHDLLRHTSGLTYGGRGSSPVHKLYPAGSAPAAFQYSGEEFIAKIASLPLLYQPGTVWDYGFSADVLGLVVEKITGKRLGGYLQTAVWDKVKMPDTGFALSAVQRERVARTLPVDPLSKRAQKIDVTDRAVKFDCGGSCAHATVGDYLRFGQMLLDGGAIDGVRVLSAKTVAVMTSDHLGPNISNNVPLVEPQRDGYSFGLGVAVRMHDGLAATPGSKGDYSWNGAYGTQFWVDPQERLVVVVGTAAPGEIRKYYREQLGALVYGAMSELRAARK
ncbi:MAG: class A beta-lactamase-related serine hydrolase [Betaproteobacteria bacterium]|nr:class A beta-lactamase-related serine hydrolase [Betaproteobacteria bacterium]